MKTITTEQLAELTWTVEGIDVGDHEWQEHLAVAYLDDEGVEIEEPVYESYVFGTCTLRSVEHPEITYIIEWVAEGGKDTYTSAYDFDVTFNELGSNELDTGNIAIVDEDGDALQPREAERELGFDIMHSVEWEREVHQHLPTMPETDDIDYDEDSSMDTIKLSRDSGADVRFSGEQVAEASSRGMDSTRWTELTLYRTQGGKWVCHEIGRSLWQGERTRRTLYIAETEAELIDQVGYGRLAKELYDEAEIDHAIEIE